MNALQHNATTYNPNQLALTRVARYERTIAAPLVRVWENVLDWEHLPHLHASSFDYIELDAAGDWGWRTWSDAERQGHVELCIASDSRYVARTYFGEQQVTEIWTTLSPAGEHTDITVEFYLPDVEEANADALGNMMVTLYTRLWDEDEAMMRERHRRLQETRDSDERLNLGNEQALTAKLQAGEHILFQLKKREYQLRYHEGKLLTHPTICPHLLGPLRDPDLSAGTLTCPWHGYRFDLASGQCLSPEHASCSLPVNAVLEERDGDIIASVGR